MNLWETLFKQNKSIRRKVCPKFFLGVLGIKKSSPVNEVFKSRSQVEDRRGKHKNHPKKFCEFMENDKNFYSFPSV